MRPMDETTSNGVERQPLFALLQNSRDGIVILDLAGRVLYANPAATALFRREQSELLGGDLGLPLSKAAAEDAGADEITVLEIHPKKGPPRTVELAATETVWRDKPAWLAMLRDITAQIEAEEKYRLIADTSGDLIVEIQDDAITYISPAVESLLGYSPAEFRELGLVATAHPEDREHVRGTLEQAGTGSKSWNGTLSETGRVRFVARHQRRDGSYRWFETVGQRRVIETGREIAVFNTRDVSDRIEGEQTLERSVQEKQYLLQELNHRVKNNLSLVSALIYTKEDALGGRVDLSDLRNRIDTVRLVYDKLQRAEEVSAVNLHDYLNDLLTTVFASLSRCSVKLEAEIESVQVPPKLAVPLGLIVNEIATNAVKHAFGGHDPPKEACFRASLSTKESNQDYALVLSNNGPPIPESVDLENPASLGMQLVTLLSKQIGGRLELVRAPQPIYTIQFELEPF